MSPSNGYFLLPEEVTIAVWHYGILIFHTFTSRKFRPSISTFWYWCHTFPIWELSVAFKCWLRPFCGFHAYKDFIQVLWLLSHSKIMHVRLIEDSKFIVGINVNILCCLSTGTLQLSGNHSKVYSTSCSNSAKKDCQVAATAMRTSSMGNVWKDLVVVCHYAASSTDCNWAEYCPFQHFKTTVYRILWNVL